MQTPNTQQTILKSLLKRANLSLEIYNMNRHPNIWHSIYKWNYDHNLLKNLLKLTNKTLKGLNKYHVFKIDYIYMLIGMGLGYIVSEAEKGYEELERLEIKPAVNKLLIDNVLNNHQIAGQLKHVLNENIFTNEDIQTNLHFLLINKVLIPQQPNINNIVKMGILTVLKSEEIFNLVQDQLVTGIEKNKTFIANETFKFLKSDTMLSIVTNNVAPLINSESTQYEVSKLVKELVNSQLKNDQNQEALYEFLREKIIF